MDTSSVKEQLDLLLDEPLSSIQHREMFTFDELASPFERSLVLFGAGNLGKKTLAGLRRLGTEPLAFADNNPDLWGKEVDGVKVLSLPQAADMYGQRAAFLIAIWKGESPDRMSDRRQQLLDLGCRRVLHFGFLFWKYPETFLPHYAIDLPHKVYEQSDQVRNAFSLWGDVKSQIEYVAQIRWRMWMDFDCLPAPVTHKIYFPDDLVKIRPEDVFVDCGAYDGDTIRDLVNIKNNSFKKIIAFEPDPANFIGLQAFVRNLPAETSEQISLHQKATGARNGKVQFTATGTSSASVGNGDLEVDCVALDDVLNDDISYYIKMDIEGSEIDTLFGARNLIEKDYPVFAVSAYHHQDHVWRIPSIIDSFSKRYRFFLRPHVLEIWDLVCYAIPVDRLI